MWKFDPVGAAAMAPLALAVVVFGSLVAHAHASLKKGDLYNRKETGVKGVGSWGGTCTCPNGEVFNVGDNSNGCRSLACVGGVSGKCGKTTGPGVAGVRVTCNAIFGLDHVVDEVDRRSRFGSVNGGQYVFIKGEGAPKGVGCPPAAPSASPTAHHRLGRAPRRRGPRC